MCSLLWELDTLMVPARSCFGHAPSTQVIAHPPVASSRSAWYHDHRLLAQVYFVSSARETWAVQHARAA